jgi:hypothetical protein
MFLPLQGADGEGDSGDVLVWQLVSIMHVLVFILVLEELTENSFTFQVKINTVKIFCSSVFCGLLRIRVSPFSSSLICTLLVTVIGREVWYSWLQ